MRRKSALFLGRRGPARESVLNFAVAGTFREASAAIAVDHLAPECHGARMAHIFDDFPLPREAVENQRRGIAAYAGSAVLHTYEELRHAIVGRLFARFRDARPRNQRKADGIRAF